MGIVARQLRPKPAVVARKWGRRRRTRAVRRGGRARTAAPGERIGCRS